MKHEFLVGYQGDRQVLYGKDDSSGNYTFAEAMTKFQAEAFLKRLPCVRSTAVLYKLVPVKTHVVTEEDRHRFCEALRRREKKALAAERM